ncbi:glycoside hydrolase family 5 protein [uncultured Maribacter sp.]|uniref:glycoside hydrolase family 5 protein n=1 Tax=uncultured Maribacter sp. TaxID=431308 RepID=UPI00262BA32C|nr:glycoside hydrolase family 5 protein [uncultured Maribacter sp.]
MKRCLQVVLVVFLIFISCKKNNSSAMENDDIENVDSNSAVGTYGQLSVRGNKIVNKNNEPIQLRGMSLFWSQWMGQYYTKETVSWLKEDWEVTVVRAAMGVDEGEESYIYRPEIEKEKVFRVINGAIEAGVYVIVDWHSHHAEDYVEEAKTFFSEVAQKYGNQPNIIYEIYNEPLDVSWDTVLKPYHEAVIEEIRKYDANNIIVCGTRLWSQRVDEVISNPIQQDNIAYTLHYYSSTHKQELRAIATLAINADIALFVTEFGVSEASGDGVIDVSEANIWWDFLDENKISWCNWSIADKEEASAALYPGASGTGNWSNDEITTSGKMVKTELKEKNQDFK